MSEVPKEDAARKREQPERHDNLIDTDQTEETLSERAMNAADEAGSALLEHDKVTRRVKDHQ